MTPELSKSQVDKLGEALRRADIDPATTAALDAYRRTFEPAYQGVVDGIQRQLGLTATGRPGKTTRSIVEKLNRESIRLSQIQDIAGCRIVVPDIPEQEQAVHAIRTHFADLTLIDRRARPSHGYRAVHAVVKVRNRHVEVQVRTVLQHLWAEYSEIIADVVDRDLKYGGGSEEARNLLHTAADIVAQIEAMPLNASGVAREQLRQKLIESFKTLMIPTWERLRR